MDAYSYEHLLRAHSVPGTPTPRAGSESRVLKISNTSSGFLKKAKEKRGVNIAKMLPTL